jgi:hypothetical protein
MVVLQGMDFSTSCCQAGGLQVYFGGSRDTEAYNIIVFLSLLPTISLLTYASPVPFVADKDTLKASANKILTKRNDHAVSCDENYESTRNCRNECFYCTSAGTLLSTKVSILRSYGIQHIQIVCWISPPFQPWRAPSTSVTSSPARTNSPCSATPLVQLHAYKSAGVFLFVTFR